MSTRSSYWDEVERDLNDPEYLRDFITESVRVRAVDSIVNALSEALERDKLSKADVARAIQARPEVVRRLLTAESPNPTIGTISEVAAALGLELTLQPMDEVDRELITDTLRNGKALNNRAVLNHLAATV